MVLRLRTGRRSAGRKKRLVSGTDTRCRVPIVSPAVWCQPSQVSREQNGFSRHRWLSYLAVHLDTRS